MQSRNNAESASRTRLILPPIVYASTTRNNWDISSSKSNYQSTEYGEGSAFNSKMKELLTQYGVSKMRKTYELDNSIQQLEVTNERLQTFYSQLKTENRRVKHRINKHPTRKTIISCQA